MYVCMYVYNQKADELPVTKKVDEYYDILSYVGMIILVREKQA